jgi:hypothetical protein
MGISHVSERSSCNLKKKIEMKNIKHFKNELIFNKILEDFRSFKHLESYWLVNSSARHTQTFLS